MSYGSWSIHLPFVYACHNVDEQRRYDRHPEGIRPVWSPIGGVCALYRLIAVLVLVLAPWMLPARSSASAQPDLVLIAVDDMTESDWAVLPKTADLLPAVYPNYFITEPICCPS